MSRRIYHSSGIDYTDADNDGVAEEEHICLDNTGVNRNKGFSGSNIRNPANYE